MHVLLFDIDGTLIDAGGAGQSAMEAALAEEFGAHRPVMGIPAAGRTDRAIAVDLFRYHEIELNEGHFSRYLTSYLRLLPQSLQSCPGAVLPGVVTLIEQLSRRDDVALGLLTGNFSRGAELKLAHYGLHHHFPFGGFGDAHLDRDDVAREALDVVRGRHPDLETDRIWVIGDTPSDVRCARAIGANVLAVATGMYSISELEPHRPDLLLADLTRPEPWLSRLDQRTRL